MTVDNWTPISTPPTEAGWYEIKTISGEFEAPFVSNMAHYLDWVVPDKQAITHWRPKQNNNIK